MKQIWIRGFDGWPLITKNRTMVNFDGSPRLVGAIFCGLSVVFQNCNGFISLYSVIG